MGNTLWNIESVLLLSEGHHLANRECGRACGVEFTYHLSYPGKRPDWFRLNYGAKGNLRAGKACAVDVDIDISNVKLKEAALAIMLPVSVNGVKIVPKSHSPAFSSFELQNGGTRLITKRGIKGGKYRVSFQMTPSRSGKIELPQFIDVVGMSDQSPLRPPSLIGGQQTVVKHKCFVKARHSLVMSAK